jgi:hypothetical protein
VVLMHLASLRAVASVHNPCSLKQQAGGLAGVTRASYQQKMWITLRRLSGLSAGAVELGLAQQEQAATD